MTRRAPAWFVVTPRRACASTRTLRVAVAVALILVCPAVALGWTAKSSFSATVHGHQFHDVALAGDECSLGYKLYFSAPAGEAYESRAPNRNYYLFRARIKLHSGKRVTVPVFGNGAPGKRVYEGKLDTSADGCWAKTEQKLLGVDVEACRGRGCRPKEFKSP